MANLAHLIQTLQTECFSPANIVSAKTGPVGNRRVQELTFMRRKHEWGPLRFECDARPPFYAVRAERPHIIYVVFDHAGMLHKVVRFNLAVIPEKLEALLKENGFRKFVDHTQVFQRREPAFKRQY